MVNLLHLRTLLEVTRLGSFAAAAAQLGYTASAVSQQMAALERDTGVELFQRSARSVVPTEAALTMTRHASKVLTDVEALMAAASRTNDSPAQELRLGIFPSLATYVLPDILRNERWNGLGIELKVSVAEPAQTIQGLRSGGELDVVVAVEEGDTRWGELPIRSDDGKVYRLDEVVRVTAATSPRDRLHVDRRRAVAVVVRGDAKTSAAALQKLVGASLPGTRPRTVDPRAVDGAPW